MCAAPVAPTLTSLATQALKRAGHSSPTTDQLATAEDVFMEEIKNDIFIDEPKMKSLFVTANLIVTNGKSRYPMPTDYSSGLTLNLLFGNTVGNVQAGTINTVTLDPSETITEDRLLGQNILITLNTGKGSMSQSVAYNSATKVATVDPNFTTAPGGTSTYMVVETFKHLSPGPVWNLDKIDNPTSPGEPHSYFPIGDSDSGEFILNPVPVRNDGKVYGLQCRYYANLMKIDLASTLMATLYQRWRNVWLQGIFAKQLKEDDDNRAETAERRYRALIVELSSREVYGMDSSDLQMTVDEQWP